MGRQLRRWARRHPHVIGLLCGLCAVAPFASLLSPGFFAFDLDILGYTMPIRVVAAQALADGHFPLWDAYAQCGQSLSGNPASAIFYPVFWLLLGHGGWGGFIAFSLFHYLLWGWAAYIFFAIGLRCRLGPALLGAIMIACSGYAYSMFFATQQTTLPWLFVAATAWICAVRKGRADAAILAGVSLAMAFLAGFLQHVIIGLACLLAGTAMLRGARLFCGVRTCVLAGVAAFTICLIPMQQIWRGHAESVRRAGIQYETATRWSTHPMRALELAMPYVWGVPHPGEPYVGAAVRRARGGKHHMDWSPSIFLGTAFLFLLPLPVRRCRKRLALGAWLLTGGALYMAMGRHAPGHETLFGLLPPLQIFRYPEKWLVWVTIGLALLSALKLEAYGDSPRYFWRLLVLPGLVLVALWFITAALPLEQVDPRIVLRNNASIAQLVALTMAVGIAAFFARRRAVAWPVAVLLVTSVIAGTQRVNRMRPPGMKMPDPLTVVTPVSQHLEGVDMAEFRVHRRGGDIVEAPALSTPEGAGLRKLYLQEDAAPVLCGLRTTKGLHPNETARYTMLRELLARQPWKLAIVTSSRFVSMPLADAEEIARAVTDAPFGTALVEVPTAPPRVRLIARSFAADSDHAALGMLDAMSVEDLTPGAVIEGAVPAHGGGELRTSQSRSGLLRASVSSEAGTVLYYGDCRAPGWQARIDGKTVPILPANFAFMAVYVPPGKHEVELRYAWH
jgi:hypothetical protein